jgi:hypothetical protein
MENSAYLLSYGKIGIIFATGFIAGVFNTMAAGGSLITLPALIFVGLPSAVANGTNRIAIFVQSLSAIYVFQTKGKMDVNLVVLLSGPSIWGCLIGAQMAIDLSDDFFRKFLAIMMLIIVGLILWNPTCHLQARQSAVSLGKKVVWAAVFFFIGMYGGLLMAGIGFFIIAALALIAGIDLVRSNAQKIFIIGVFNMAGVLVSLLYGKIDWLAGAVLASGQGIGAWIGSHLAIQKGEKWIRVFLLISVVGMSLKLAGIFPSFG